MGIAGTAEASACRRWASCEKHDYWLRPGHEPMRCKLGLEGIVSKRLGSTYRSGRTSDWLKFKNPDAPAVKREAEEEWGKDKKPRQADGAKVTLQRRPSVLKAKGSPISL